MSGFIANVGNKITNKQLKRLMKIGKLKNIYISQNTPFNSQDIFTYQYENIIFNLYLPREDEDGCLYFLKENQKNQKNNKDLVEIYFKATQDGLEITEIINFMGNCYFILYKNFAIKIKET